MNKKFKVHFLRICDIAPNPNQRKLKKQNIVSLAANIENLGLKTPISVKRLLKGKFKYQLVVGAHRLAAYQSLGRTKVPAYIFSNGEADIWSVSENILRFEPSALRRAEDWVALAGHVVPKSTPKGGVQPNDKGFKKLARILRVSPKTVSRSFRHAGLEQSVKDLLFKYELDGNGSFLTELAKLDDLNSKIQLIQKRRKERKEKKSAAKMKQDSAASQKLNTEEDGDTESADPGTKKKSNEKKGWIERFGIMQKSWKKSEIATLYSEADRKMKVAFLRKIFDGGHLAKAVEKNKRTQ